MFIFKKHLSRRTMLRGLGASVGLPLLDAMIPAGTALAKTAAAPRPRMAFIYFPHGAVMQHWAPKREGTNFDLPPILAPLAPFQNQLTIVSGLENRSAVAAPVHAITPGTWLSCVRPRMSHEPCGGITVDQIVAKRIGRDTPLPSLEMATEEQGGEGSYDPNYGSGYCRTISFRTPTTPLPMEHNPRKLFQKLFEQGGPTRERELGARRNVSIVDRVRQDAANLQRTLGPRDRATLDDYLSSVREIERRVHKIAARDLSDAKPSDSSAGMEDHFGDRMQLMYDLLALAFQANLTRVASFMTAAEVSTQPYTFIGVSDDFHSLSHHQNDPRKMERLARVQTYNTQVFAKFVKKLADMPDGEGSMLDHSIILYGSNMSNSNLHDHFPLPAAIVGGGCGRIRGNLHLRCPDRTPIANMLLTLMDRAGVHMDKFADSTGLIAEI